MVELAVEGLWSELGARGRQLLRFAAGGPFEIAAAPAGAARVAGLFALPGFVNARVHLDLSGIRGEELPRASFAEWVEALVARQRSQSPLERAAAVRSGAIELLGSGCVADGDIDAHGGGLEALRDLPLEGVVHRELLGSPPAERLADLERQLAEQARALAAAVDPAGAALPRLRSGLSPHAPYSTSAALYEQLFALARRHDASVASHVAESEEELVLLAEQRGPLWRLFERMRFTPPSWPLAASGPLAALDALSPPDGFVVIHGNRLNRTEIELCAKRRWPVVYCPRSHAYFGYAPHPAPALLAAGGTVALGTDSRASNSGLDLHAELATWRRLDRSLPDAVLLTAATAAGRRALRLPRAELVEGDPATFQLVRGRTAPLRSADELLPAAVRGELETVAVWIRGELAWSKERGVITLRP